MQRVFLEADEVRSIQGLLAELAARYRIAESPDFHREAPVIAHELPRRLRKVLVDFRLIEPQVGHCVIAGYPIDQERIGPTPEHWKLEEPRERTVDVEMLLVLFGSLLGECIGWTTQQDGRLVHDIFPINGHQGEQLGSGSEQLLWWHTEDAFHPYRGDYLGMACVRNHDRVPTTFATLQRVQIDPELWSLLFEPHFTIRPDESHLKKNNSDRRSIEGGLQSSYSRIEQMNTEPEKIALLFGDPNAPYMRLDPFFMDKPEDPKAQQALDALCAAIDSSLIDLVLEPGDFCFIDNFQGVHGRKPFKARFDGTDRWLKRVNIARDLRKSRDARPSAENRCIG